MKQLFLSLFGLVALIGCTNPGKTTSDAQKSLIDTYTPKIGTATKNELMEHFGNPEWCKLEDNGTETCRFYRKSGTKWIGEKTQKDKKSLEQFEQLIADFDGNGILKGFKASAQK